MKISRKLRSLALVGLVLTGMPAYGAESSSWKNWASSGLSAFATNALIVGIRSAKKAHLFCGWLKPKVIHGSQILAKNGSILLGKTAKATANAFKATGKQTRKFGSWMQPKLAHGMRSLLNNGRTLMAHTARSLESRDAKKKLLTFTTIGAVGLWTTYKLIKHFRNSNQLPTKPKSSYTKSQPTFSETLIPEEEIYSDSSSEYDSDEDEIIEPVQFQDNGQEQELRELQRKQEELDQQFVRAVENYLATEEDPNEIFAFVKPVENLNAIEELLQKGANINSPCGADSPLIAATKNGNIELLKLLMKHGANPFEQTQYTVSTEYGWGSRISYKSCFSVAIEEKNLKFLDALLTNTCDTHTELRQLTINSYLQNALNNRMNNYDAETVRLLIKHGATINPAHFQGAIKYALQNSNVELVQLLMELGVTISQSEADQYLSNAVNSLCPDKVLLSIKLGANVNNNLNYSPSSTPLMWLSEHAPNNADMRTIAQHLIFGGADLEVEDIDGNTALIHAFKTGKLDLVRLVLLQKKQNGKTLSEKEQEVLDNTQSMIRMMTAFGNNKSDVEIMGFELNP